MSLRNKIFLAGESFLRVPPLLLMDEIFRYNFGLGFNSKQKHLKSAETEFTLHGGSATTEEMSKDFSNQRGDTGAAALTESLVDATKQSISELWGDLFNSSNGPDENIQAIPSGSQILENMEQTPQLSSHYYSFGIGMGEWEAYPGVSQEFLSLLEVFICLILFTALLVIFVLSTENLIKLYSFLTSYFLLYVAYIYTPLPSVWTYPFLPMFAYNILIRCVLVTLYILTCSRPDNRATEDTYGISSVLQMLSYAIFFITGVIQFDVAVYIFIIIVLNSSLWKRVPETYMFLKTSLADTRRVRNEYGISHLIQTESSRLRINSVFRLFWCSKAAYNALYQYFDQPLMLIFRHVVAQGTETFTGIIGLTVTVSAICHQVGEFLLWILYYGGTSETDANRFGSISTVLFFILSLQTGITSLDPEKRLDRLLKNIVLLGTALFHALHQMLSPLLHAFRTFQALQIRAVILSVSFFCLSVFSTACLLRTSTLSTWSLAVLALALEFKIKIFISLMISVVVYMSQVVQYPDWMQKSGDMLRIILPQPVYRFFGKLHDTLSPEDVVFYLTVLANGAEFFTGIFLFGNAVWIFLFESASAIRAIGMSIHAYFNIWCQSKKGWKIYCQRKTASMKIMSLADATPEQLLEKRDDVCSICYEEMESAKVTTCGHLFHAVCLRKWLYVQNNCPLCHEVLYAEEVQQNNNEDEIRIEVPVRVENPENLVPQASGTDADANLNQVPEVNPGESNISFTTYNGIRFYDLTAGIYESDADADDESSDDESVSGSDDYGDNNENNAQRRTSSGNGGLVLLL